MTSPIAAIGAVTGLGAVGSVGSVSSAIPSLSAGTATSGANFATALGHGLDAVQGAQNTADGLAVQAAAGTLVDPAQYTMAATQAQLMTQLATTLESKAVAAFNQIMGMQA
jgi:flagellar hook-basal body complex protein FliE